MIRPAEPADAATIHRFIIELADYEKARDEVEVTPALLAEQMAGERPPFEALIVEDGAEPVGFALYFQSYSTWRGRPGLYLEDLYVTPAARGCGFGRALLQRLAQITLDRGWARMEWAVLDWNASAIAFYKSLGAAPIDQWKSFRLSAAPLAALARR